MNNKLNKSDNMSCSICGELKSIDRCIIKQNICKECRNKNTIAVYKHVDVDFEIEKTCTSCSQEMPISFFLKKRLLCIDCNNQKRRNK